MKMIQLTQNKIALVDDDDFRRLRQWKWFARKNNNIFYAVRSTHPIKGKQKTIAIHREVLGLIDGDGKQVDHINRNGLDNRKSNLRICTHSQNNANRIIEKGGTSKYRGVYWNINSRKWISQIKCNGKQIHLGCFINEVEAARAYDRKAVELFGEFAKLNIGKEAT